MFRKHQDRVQFPGGAPLSDTMPVLIDRRHNPRGIVNHHSLVIIKTKTQRIKGHVVNLSIGGALIHAPELITHRNASLELVFAGRVSSGLNMANVFKLHYKRGIVIHVTNGNIGVCIGNR